MVSTRVQVVDITCKLFSFLLISCEFSLVFSIDLWKPCNYNKLNNSRLYSSVVAGAREALINGVPSISISLNWSVFLSLKYLITLTFNCV